MAEYKKIKSNSGLISFGNTGARLSDPRATYVKILEALKDFRLNNSTWETADQEIFANILNEKSIFEINSNTVIGVAKDVRVKTGFISQLGFTDENRIITNVGHELIDASKNFDLNELEISKESYIYFKQFLKYQQEDFDIIPLLSLIYSCIEFKNELPVDFVTYVWSSAQSEGELKQNIIRYREFLSYKKTVYHSILDSENTKIAAKNIELFYNEHSISNKHELYKLFYAILPHGKGDSYKDKSIKLFFDLYAYWSNKSTWDNSKKKKFINTKLKSRHKDISSKSSSDYVSSMFGTNSFKSSSNWDKIIEFFEMNPLMSSEDEPSLILNFHIFYMFIKKLSICNEYSDLNFRHLKLLDIFIFEYDKVKLDLIFWYLFKSVKNELLQVSPLSNEQYKIKLRTSQKNIGEIYNFLDFDPSQISSQIESDYPEIKALGLKNFAFKKKEERLQQLVNTTFTRENLIKIFENIFPRNDDEVRKILKEWHLDYDATIPALFEYLLGISFYWLSEKNVKLSDLLHSGLDSNLLPKSHTPGGKADIVVKCNEKHYLIEVTLSENDTQRQMESEPVPRHLAKHIAEVSPNSIALFVAGQLDRNNLVVLRNYKFSPWYFSDEKYVESMDILPLTISNMIYILKRNMKLIEFESITRSLLDSENRNGFNWYTQEVNKVFKNGN